MAALPSERAFYAARISLLKLRWISIAGEVKVVVRVVSDF